MPRLSRIFLLCGALSLVVAGNAQSSYVEQHLHDRYQGKTLLLRGFYSDDHLRYDAGGMPLRGATPGDWTADGFVLVNDLHFPHGHLRIQAQRVAVFLDQKEFHLRPAEQTIRGEKTPVLVELDVDLGKDNSVEKFDDALAKIFLTDQDHIADLVPDYWKPCVPDGLIGKDSSCHFSKDLLTIPGFTPPETTNSGPATETEDLQSSIARRFHVEKGVKPPHLTFNREPEFSARARQAKYQGTVILGLTVSNEGLPTNIFVLSPLGSGLDAQAVRAVEKWKFDPAEKDGQPVSVRIAVEVDFHLY